MPIRWMAASVLVAGLATGAAAQVRSGWTEALPVEDLQLMTEVELVGEAGQLCSLLATGYKPGMYGPMRAVPMALDYLDRIGRVARAKRSGGGYPPWYAELRAVMSGPAEQRTGERCNAIVQKYGAGPNVGR